MRCPICNQEGIHLGGGADDMWLTSHMYNDHEDELGEEQTMRWGRTPARDPAPLGITNQEQLDAYCDTLGLLNHPSAPTTGSGIGQINAALDRADGSDYDYYLEEARKYWKTVKDADIGAIWAAYFVRHGSEFSQVPTATVNAFKTAIQALVDTQKSPKVAAFIQTLQR